MNKITKLPIINLQRNKLFVRSPNVLRTIKRNSLKSIKIDVLLIEKTSKMSTIQNPRENLIKAIKPKEKQMNYLYQKEFKPTSQLICDKMQQLNTEFKNTSKASNRKMLFGYNTLDHSKDNKLFEKQIINSYSYRKNIHELYDRLKGLNSKELNAW